jgi:hypothetical protein
VWVEVKKNEEWERKVVDEKDLIAFLCKLKLDFDCINNNEKQSFVTVEKVLTAKKTFR